MNDLTRPRYSISNITYPLVFIIFSLSLPTQAENKKRDLVMWNKLGSEYEVLHSEVGANFDIELVRISLYDPEPRVYYVDGAVGTYGGGDYYGGGGRLRMNSDDFFPADKTKGTVEVWIQKKIPKLIPYETPLVTIFGEQMYARDDENGYDSIIAWWSDGLTGDGGLQFQIRDGNNEFHYIRDLGWDDVPVNQWTHVAFVWDLDGIKGKGNGSNGIKGSSKDKMRIYRDGIITARSIDNIPGIYPDEDRVKVLTHHASNRFSESIIYLDDIKVWNYAKTLFLLID